MDQYALMNTMIHSSVSESGPADNYQEAGMAMHQPQIVPGYQVGGQIPYIVDQNGNQIPLNGMNNQNGTSQNQTGTGMNQIVQMEQMPYQMGQMGQCPHQMDQNQYQMPMDMNQMGNQVNQMAMMNQMGNQMNQIMDQFGRPSAAHQQPGQQIGQLQDIGVLSLTADNLQEIGEGMKNGSDTKGINSSNGNKNGNTNDSQSVRSFTIHSSSSQMTLTGLEFRTSLINEWKVRPQLDVSPCNRFRVYDVNLLLVNRTVSDSHLAILFRTLNNDKGPKDMLQAEPLSFSSMVNQIAGVRITIPDQDTDNINNDNINNPVFNSHDEEDLARVENGCALKRDLLLKRLQDRLGGDGRLVAKMLIVLEIWIFGHPDSKPYACLEKGEVTNDGRVLRWQSTVDKWNVDTPTPNDQSEAIESNSKPFDNVQNKNGQISSCENGRASHRNSCSTTAGNSLSIGNGLLTGPAGPNVHGVNGNGGVNGRNAGPHDASSESNCCTREVTPREVPVNVNRTTDNISVVNTGGANGMGTGSINGMVGSSINEKINELTFGNVNVDDALCSSNIDSSSRDYLRGQHGGGQNGKETPQAISNSGINSPQQQHQRQEPEDLSKNGLYLNARHGVARDGSAVFRELLDLQLKGLDSGWYLRLNFRFSSFIRNFRKYEEELYILVDKYSNDPLKLEKVVSEYGI